MKDYGNLAKQVIKGIGSPMLDFCGIYDAVLERKVFAQPGWLILMYHRVTASRADDPFSLGMCVNRKRFAEQIAYHTQAPFTPIGMSEAVARIHSGRALPPNAVSITFDDGYRDFREHALPVLRKYQCPATVFVTTGGVRDNRPFWWDRVIDIVHRTPRRDVDVRELSMDANTGFLSLGRGQRRESLQQLLNLLWEQPAERIESAVDRLAEQLEVLDRGAAQAARMSFEDVAAVAAEGIEIGAHCVQHVDLRNVSEGRCFHELHESRRVLQDVTGQAINGFAFPGGRQNSDVQRFVAQSGFTYSAGTDRGINRQPYDMFNLRRIGMPDTVLADYKRCLGNAAGAPPTALRYEGARWP